MPKQSIRLALLRTPVFVIWGSLILLSVTYGVTLIWWPRMYFRPAIAAAGFIIFLALGIFVLIQLARIAEEIGDTFRAARKDFHRCMCAVRAAKSAWAAWDSPEIAERRQALARRARADQCELDRALMKVAHQREAE